MNGLVSFKEIVEEKENKLSVYCIVKIFSKQNNKNTCNTCIQFLKTIPWCTVGLSLFKHGS